GWPGNIRQLRNCMESAVVMCMKNEITLDDLPPTISGIKDAADITVPVGVTLEEAE
ncbi:MAG TPA: transcriptional regulator, partial [Treponema sp.]|nr:transcriptional regulator [Treponema sp.]